MNCEKVDATINHIRKIKEGRKNIISHKTRKHKL